MTDTLADGIASAEAAYWLPSFMDKPVLRAVTADGAPVVPPSTWFVDPGLAGPTPLIVEGDGRVFGHIATWRQSHIGMAGSIKAPRSRSNPPYAFFATGSILTEDDQTFNVGQLTLVGGHADLDCDVPRAVAHYDDTRSAVADVAIGEDRHGIWVAGALRPDVDASKVRVLRASGVSGDWRPINGNLELVAVCSVNVPGFPVPRARVASGAVLALVACGVEELTEVRLQQLTAAAVIEVVDSMSDRLAVVEQQFMADHPELFNSQDAPVEPIAEPDQSEVFGEDFTSSEDARMVLVNQLRGRVYAPLIEALETETDELLAHVNGDSLDDLIMGDLGQAAPIDDTLIDDLPPVAQTEVLESLRKRAHGVAE